MSTPEGMLVALLEASLAKGEEARFQAEGRSMLPLIRPGDALRVRALVDAEPAVGDVVAVRGMPGGKILVHRIVKKTQGSFIIRGDNTMVTNGSFAHEEILGVVTAVERGGRPVWFGAGRWGRIVAVAVRTGAVNVYNRVCLKFSAAESRLREHKGDDGNE